MSFAANFATPLAAFTAGLVTSLHCAAMCGPLGCALLNRQKCAPREQCYALACYHGSRMLAYAAVGGLLGWIGRSAAGLFHAPISRMLPWAFAALFLIVAFGWEQKLPRPVFVGRWLFRLNLRGPAQNMSRTATVLGLATPFLPCGPLYLAFGVALVAGSAWGGVQVMAPFALGTIPLFAVAQFSAWRWQTRLAPATWMWTRRGLALASAGLITARALLSDGTLLAPLKCLLCR
jgi:sulfite exporter TauE/SafE